MKIRYKPPYGDEISFDPATEIFCPLCGAVMPVPVDWKTHTSIIRCDNIAHHGSDDPQYYHPATFFDINCLIDDNDPQMTAYRIHIGMLHEEDIAEWLKLRTMWDIMWSCGGPPSWRIEPEPFWRHRLYCQNKDVTTGGQHNETR